MTAPRVCPICGAQVPPESRTCAECGSDEQTGWSDAAYAPQPDLPDEEFDYDEFVRREFHGSSHCISRVSIFWVLVTLVVLAALLLVWLK